MEFRRGRYTTELSPKIKMRKSAAKKRLTYLVPSASSVVNTKDAEVQPTIVHTEETNERLRKFMSGLLKSGCQAYALAHLSSPVYDEKTLGGCQQKIETMLNDKYSRSGYTFKAKFGTIEGNRARDWDADALFLKIGRKNTELWDGSEPQDDTNPFTQVLQCLFAGRNTYRKKFLMKTRELKFRPLLLVNDSGNFFCKIRDILLETFKIYITALSPIMGQELKVFCGRCFLISFIQKNLDFKDSMVLAAKFKRNYEGEEKSYETECRIPLVYFKEFVSHSTLAQVTNNNVLEIWYQFFRSFGGHVPINYDFPLTEVSFPNFRFTSQGEMQLIDPSLELCHEVLENFTKFAEKGSRSVYKQ